jgi:hypothetical protein
MQIKTGKTVLRLVTGDIAVQDTDAVVTREDENAANGLTRMPPFWFGECSNTPQRK